MLRGSKDRHDAGEPPAPEKKPSKDAEEMLAASVLVLRQSVTDLRALTDEEALDLRAHIRSVEGRLSMLETRLELIADSTARLVASANAGTAKADRAARKSAREAARVHKKRGAMRKTKARRERTAAREAKPSSEAGEQDRDDDGGGEPAGRD